jgi:hypothetical protein
MNAIGIDDVAGWTLCQHPTTLVSFNGSNGDRP